MILTGHLVHLKATQHLTKEKRLGLYFKMVKLKLTVVFMMDLLVVPLRLA